MYAADIMVTDDNKMKVLEVNITPGKKAFVQNPKLFKSYVAWLFNEPLKKYETPLTRGKDYVKL